MNTIDRRRFLGVVAGLGVTSCVPQQPEPEAMLGGKVPKKVLVGAHPWVYAAPRAEYDIYGVLDEIFPDMAYAGMDFIELMHTALEPEDAVERIGILSEEHDLPVIGTSYSAPMWKKDEHEKIFEYSDRMIERLQRLGARTIGTSVGAKPDHEKKTPEELDAQAEILRRIMFRASSNGIEVNLHNHTYEVENGEHDLNGTIERIPDVKLGPDLDWLVGGGVDPVDFIKRHGSRMVFAHLRDRGEDGVWVEAMGEGAIDYKAIGEALREVNFAGDMAIELAHPKDFTLTRPLKESLKMSRDFVRETVGY
jgi:sugar phosphate isomerase/epimerase